MHNPVIKREFHEVYMTTFAERFVAEIHGKPAPIVLDPDGEDRDNHPECIYKGGLETIAENCNQKDYDPYEADIDDSIPDILQDGAGTYYFKDGSKAGVRYNFHGKWDAWVMK